MAETCYRHPREETKVECSSCGRPICPECMNFAPVGIRCPECASERTVVRQGSAAFENLEGPIVTYAVMALCVLIFVGQYAGGEGGTTGRLFVEGALFGPAVSDGGQWWRLVTSGFLHASFLHLGFNLFALYILGSLVEPMIGRARYLAVYGVSLLGGSFGALILDPNVPTIGASGAVYGLLALAFFYARDRGFGGVASQIGLWLVFNLVITFAVPRISVGGHLGGLATGALCAGLLLWAERSLDGRQARIASAAGLVVLAVVSVAGALAAANAGSAGPVLGFFGG
ncbi:MAG: rhomboid family intramembrane serine protease [Solirubrobacterales bacterium]